MLNFPARRILVAWIPVQTFCASAIVVGSLLAPAIAHAQASWTSSLTPSVNPLAIGGCGAVRLTLTDAKTRDWPRNPAGSYVSLADFDMSVTSQDPIGVAGEYNGPTIWSACACQAATVGSTATITATYPAKMLAQKQQVPGVAFQATTTFTIDKPRGAYEPLSCQALKSQPMVATGSAAAAGTTTVMAPAATRATPTFGGATSGAVTCTTGQTQTGSGCMNLPAGAACPTGVADGLGGCGAPRTVTCTTGQTQSGSGCMNMPAGTACPTGVADGMGGCRSPTTVTCTTGQTPSGSGCLNLPKGAVCPTGVADGMGGCGRPPTVTCTAGQTQSGSGCMNLPKGAACPTGVADGMGGCVATPPVTGATGQTMRVGKRVTVVGANHIVRAGVLS